MNPDLAKLPPEAQERMAKAMSRNGMMISSVVSIFVAVPIIYLLQSLYFLIAGKVAGGSMPFKHWFSMVTWCSLPSLVGIVAGAAVLLTENSPMQISQMQLQVLSLNELFFHLPMSAKGATLLSSLTLLAPWSWALLTICVRTWTNRSWLGSATFALLPNVLWYAGWAFIAFK